MESSVSIFCDFDGTVAKQDVGDLLIENFGAPGCRELEAKYIKQEISARDCLIYYYETMQATTEEIIQYIDENVELDETFLAFYKYCRRNEYPIYILSGGMDFYIEFVLDKYKIDLPYYANKYLDKEEVITEYPYFNEQCGMCGHCKRNSLKRLKDEGDYTVYVGDGYTDRCVSEAVDLLFAKDKLAEYCQQNNIDYVAYNSFAEVLEVVKNEL